MSLSFQKLSFILTSMFLIQAMSKFMAASRQAYELDKDRVKLEVKVQDMEKESSHRIGERMKLEVEMK